MACRLLGAKPLSKSMLGCCQLDGQKQTLVKFGSEFYRFHSKNAFENVVCQNGSHFVQGEMSLYASFKRIGA